MKRREFLSALAGATAFGFVGKPLTKLPTAVFPASSSPSTTPTVAPQFGEQYQVVGTQETTNGTYALLNHQGWPVWLHKATTDTVWRTTTPPWHVRRMAKLFWRFS